MGQLWDSVAGLGAGWQGQKDSVDLIVLRRIDFPGIIGQNLQLLLICQVKMQGSDGYISLCECPDVGIRGAFGEGKFA